MTEIAEEGTSNHTRPTDTQKHGEKSKTPLKLWKNWSLEIVTLIHLTFSKAISFGGENLNLSKACLVNIGFNETVCQGLAKRDHSGYSEYNEVQVQKVVSRLLIYKTVVQGMVPFILILFVGSWSDRHKRRKPLILLPICGYIVNCMGCLLCVFFFLELPVEVAMFFEAVPAAITGEKFFLFVGAYSYITERSTLESRTFRIGIITVINFASSTIGTILGGVILKYFGFYAVFIMALLMLVTAFIYGLYALEDLSPQDYKSTYTDFFADFFDFKHVKQTLVIAFKKRESTKRLQIVFSMVLLFLHGSFRGENEVEYMFVRKKFSWDPVDYSSFKIYHFLVYIVGSLLCLTVFVKWLKLNDATIGVSAMLGKIIGSLGSAIAPTTLFYYLANTMEMLNGNSSVALRAIVSKLVALDEVSQFFSLFGMIKSSTSLIFGPLYSFMYHVTVDVFPSFIFLFSAGLHGIGFILFFWLYALREPKKQEEDEDMEAEAEKMLRVKENANQ